MRQDPWTDLLLVSALKWNQRNWCRINLHAHTGLYNQRLRNVKKCDQGGQGVCSFIFLWRTVCVRRNRIMQWSSRSLNLPSLRFPGNPLSSVPGMGTRNPAWLGWGIWSGSGECFQRNACVLTFIMQVLKVNSSLTGMNSSEEKVSKVWVWKLGQWVESHVKVAY